MNISFFSFPLFLGEGGGVKPMSILTIVGDFGFFVVFGFVTFVECCMCLIHSTPDAEICLDTFPYTHQYRYSCTYTYMYQNVRTHVYTCTCMYPLTY